MLEDGLVGEIGAKLRKLGFRKKRLTWRRETDHGIEVFNVQRSQFGPALYINLGVYTGGEPEPHVHQCNSSTRIEHEGRDAADVYADVVAWFDRERAWREARNKPAPIETKPMRVRHVTLGGGSVVAEQGDSLRIAFDDGTTRLLKRAFLEFEDA